jgi:hypothetical protein
MNNIRLGRFDLHHLNSIDKERPMVGNPTTPKPPIRRPCNTYYFLSKPACGDAYGGLREEKNKEIEVWYKNALIFLKKERRGKN